MVNPELKLQEIRYFRRVKPPTLRQFLHRRWVSSVMNEVKGEVGTDTDPDTGRLAPLSAIKAKKLMKGKTAESLIAEHPEWVKEYNKEFGDAAGNKEA